MRSTLCPGRTLLEQLKQRDYRRVVAASIIEALELLEAAGIEPAKIGPVPPRLLPHVIAAPDFIFKQPVPARSRRSTPRRARSMADDFAAGRADRDRLSERRGGQARPARWAARRRSTRRSSSWSRRRGRRRAHLERGRAAQPRARTPQASRAVRLLNSCTRRFDSAHTLGDVSVPLERKSPYMRHLAAA